MKDLPAGQGGGVANGDFARALDSSAVRAGWKAGDWICTRLAKLCYSFQSSMSADVWTETMSCMLDRTFIKRQHL